MAKTADKGGKINFSQFHADAVYIGLYRRSLKRGHLRVLVALVSDKLQ